MPVDRKTLDNLCINAIRMLAADGVQQAASGHPGTPMALAPVAYLLWTRFLKHNPRNPAWPDRDRFVLSAGHASMLLYALLHLTGYDLSMNELKRFRQWGSKTPGHPEYGHTPGVETTTGPLGQGFANAVGMALTERILAARFNRPGHTLVDHHTYVIAGDGDMMEGISSEAASLAGHLKLGRLIAVYDDNKITIEGKTRLSFSESVEGRFAAYGWQVLNVGEVNGADDLEKVSEAVETAKDETSRPSLLIVRTHIGYGSPNRQDTAQAHGAPLGEAELRLTKAALGWPQAPPFHLPEAVKNHFKSGIQAGEAAEAAWQRRWKAYAAAHPRLAEAWETAIHRALPPGWDREIRAFSPSGAVATRSASGAVLNLAAKTLPFLIGGSADLAPSNNTVIKGGGDLLDGDFSGRNLHFGVREHAMGGILNGMALHRGVIPYGGTFLVFSDYMKPAIRLAALMGLPVLYIFTHDSIGLGEDGPTHQPIEHLAALRAIPNMTVIRPADAMETAAAWRVALSHRDGPVALILTRQKLPVLDQDRCASAEGLEKGAYILAETIGKSPRLILIATGSEVHPARSAGERLEEEGIPVRIVSMPSWELFARQPDTYRRAVLPPDDTPRLAIEAGSPFGWERHLGRRGAVIGIDRFGASAPGAVVMEAFGFTVDNIVARAKTLL